MYSTVEVVLNASPRVPPLPLRLVARQYVNRMLGLIPNGEVNLVLLRIEPLGEQCGQRDGLHAWTVPAVRVRHGRLNADAARATGRSWTGILVCVRVAAVLAEQHHKWTASPLLVLARVQTLRPPGQRKRPAADAAAPGRERSVGSGSGTGRDLISGWTPPPPAAEVVSPPARRTCIGVLGHGSVSRPALPMWRPRFRRARRTTRRRR